jgi:hypothetical protein
MGIHGSSIASGLAVLCLVAAAAAWNGPNTRPKGTAARRAVDDLLAGRFAWNITQPVLAPAQRPKDLCYSVKDPSVVFYAERWHLFCSIRGQKRSHQIEYLSFADWKQAARTKRHVLKVSDGYFCAPQVFYFRPQKKWYLICQASDASWKPKYQAAYSTTSDITKPGSWSKLTPLGARLAGKKMGLDFWVICDGKRAHLFFTTLDGRMWREETGLDEFPRGWSPPVLAIRGDIFEASHVYTLKGLGKYLTVVEAQGGHGWRYFKAYLADRLAGPWEPLAATKDKSFASMASARHSKPRWTDCISHGELLRDGYDQTLQADPANLRFLFQGVRDKDRAGRPYGQIPWRLGLLEPAARPQ